ncbi:MAG TPA: AMP-binding protein [Burkholderiaceae bacterium]|nr:AMP-binding protein [Burkholderiaceae bacterium]
MAPIAVPADAPRGTPIPNVGALTSRYLRMHGRGEAVRTSTSSITGAGLDRRSNRLANALDALGLRRGDRVAVWLPNRIEVVEVELACYKGAFAKTPVNARLSPREVAAVLADSGAALMVTTAQRAESLRPELAGERPRLLLLDVPATDARAYEAALERASDAFEPRAVGRDDLAVLHYTSGSSGVLKAAMQTFGNRLAQLRKFLMRPDGRGAPGDILGLVGPITHASGMQLAPAFCSGVTVRLFEKFEPEAYLRTMRDERITSTFMVPTMIGMVLAAIGDGPRPALPALRRLGYGAAPMAPARILEAMDVFGPVLTQGYGAGETTSGVTTLSVHDHVVARERFPERLASCGRPFAESLVEVVDEAGRVVAPGEVGEIVVSGEDVFAGYWGAPQLTAEVLKDGRYHTGDLARVDEDGFVYIVDRKKDMVITGGFNVYPTEVEAVLYQHPAVAEACVFAVPDDTWGEAVGAHLVLKAGAGATVQEIDAFCADRLAGFKRPRLVKLVPQVARNANGKVARREEQAPYWAGRSRNVN